MLLSFTDDQIRDLTIIVAPLYPVARAVFLRELAAEFGGRTAVDDGEPHRVAVRLQHDLFHPPQRVMDGRR
jgi:hypothetical protein